MKIRSVYIENFRSFRSGQCWNLHPRVNILVGPNGGGKTNLFDVLATILRRDVFGGYEVRDANSPENPNLREIYPQAAVQAATIPRHRSSLDKKQFAFLTLEATQTDVTAIVDSYLVQSKYGNFVQDFQGWDRNYAASLGDDIPIPGSTVEVGYIDGIVFTDESDNVSTNYLKFLHNVEIDRLHRELTRDGELFYPFVYFSVNRTSSGIPTLVDLPNYDLFARKFQSDFQTSRHGGGGALASLAVERLAKKHLDIVDHEGGSSNAYHNDPTVKSITKYLSRLGYAWSIKRENTQKNRYRLSITKNGELFTYEEASNGEKELISYIFTIFGLSIRDAVIMIDEPELHLHPSWQKKLIGIFNDLSLETGNQFLLATHSASIISASSLNGVTRVQIKDGESVITHFDVGMEKRLSNLFQIVQAQNNEKIFFCESVLLVEGPSDQIIIEKLMAEEFPHLMDSVEVISVTGKYFFKAYQKFLEALGIPCFVMADFDYLKQIGTPTVKSLFTLDPEKITREVILDRKSRDGTEIFEAFHNSIQAGRWVGSEELWNRIKATRLGALSPLNNSQRREVKVNIEQLAAGGVFILKRGQIEDYLPVGSQSKGIDKLVKLLATNRLEEILPKRSFLELRRIVLSMSKA